MGLADQVSLKGGQVFDTLELGMIAAARGYGVSMGDLLMVAEDVAQGRLSLPWPTAVASGEELLPGLAENPPGGERLRRLSDFLQGEARSMELPNVQPLGAELIEPAAMAALSHIPVNYSSIPIFPPKKCRWNLRAGSTQFLLLEFCWSVHRS